MNWAVLVALAVAAPARITVVDETVRVPAAGAKPIHFSLRQRPAIIECSYTVERALSGVRAELRRGGEHAALTVTGFWMRGGFRVGPAPLGDYDIVIVNDLEGRAPAEVRVVIQLAFAADGEEARELSPARRRTVVLITLIAFAWIVYFATRKLRAGIAGPPT